MRAFASCFLCFILLARLSAVVVASPLAGVTSLDLFVSGISTRSWSKGQAVCYRIPSFLRLRSGTLLAFAAERLGSDCNDESGANIVLRRSVDNGTTWMPMQLVVPTGDAKAEMSPWALQDDQTGRVFLFSNTNVRTPDCNCEVFHVISDNDGQTWSAPIVVPKSSGYYGSSLASGITHSSGRLVGCMRKICRNSCPADYHSKSFFSDDHGATWNTSEFLASGTTECQVAELSDSRLYMNMRPYTGWTGISNVRLVAFSEDAGATWGPVTADISLVDYGFADEGSVVSDPRNKVVYFSHPYSHSRANLTLYRSFDDAASWADLVTVYSGSTGYSDAAVLDPYPASARAVGVLFEKNNNGLCEAIAFSIVMYPPGRGVSGSDSIVL